MSTLEELLRPKIFAHVACGCRHKMTLCGKYEPNAIGVEIGDHVAAKVTHWCTECMGIWVSSGCGSCGCHRDALCEFCAAALREGAAMPNR